MSKVKFRLTILICILIMASLLNFNQNTLIFAKEENLANSFKLELVSSGQIEVLPDQAEVNLSIEFVDLNKELSQKSCIQISKNVKAHLIYLGIDETNIKNNNSYTYPIENYGERAFKTYANISFVSQSIDNLDDILSTLQSDYIKITNICYSSKDYDTFYEKALLEAQKNALEKAQRLYPNSIVKINKIQEIENYYPVSLYREYNPKFLETDHLTPLEITARVKVTFEIN